MAAPLDRHSLFCDRCKEEGFSQDSMAWCVDCRQHFCSECLLGNKIKRHKHRYLGTMKYREFLLNCYFGMFENCFVHSDVKSIYYCLNHQTTCCERCKRQVHSSCNQVINTEQMAMNIRTNVEFPDLTERLKDAILSFESLIDENFENRSKLDILKNKVINDVLRMREDMDNQLERIQSELLEQLEKSYEQQLGFLDNIVSYMEDIKEEVNQLRIDTELVANKLPDLELFFFVKTAEKHHLVTEKAIHELRKTSVDVKFKHDIELGIRDLTQIHKQLLKIQIKGDNISNMKLDEWKSEKGQKSSEKPLTDEDLKLPLGRDTPSTINLASPRDNVSISRLSFRSEARTVTPAYTHVDKSTRDHVGVSHMSFRSTSKTSVITGRSFGDSASQMSFRNASKGFTPIQRSPREYEQYLRKVKTGRLGQIRESERYVEDEESGIHTNIKNETFSLQSKFDLPKLSKTCFITDIRCVAKGRFVLTDYNNKCLMLYDFHGTLLKESILEDHPQCIAVMSGTDMAVTISSSKNIIIADSASLKTVRHVSAPYECEGITFTENRLIVNCIHEGIFMLSKSGKILSKFPKLTGAMYLCMSNDHKLVCSMGVSGVLLSMSLEGRETFRYKHDSFRRPSGVTSDQYGNIYVATWSDNCILQVKENGKNPNVALTSEERVTSPWGIDYDKSSDLLVVSTENGESIAIYKRHAHR